MNKKIWLFVLAVFLMLSALSWSIISGRNPAWAKYQKEYFTAQAAKLQTQLAHTSNPQQRQQLKAEIAQWQCRQPQIVNLVLPNGQVERCKTCHLGIEEISSSHPSNTFGCTVCHGGNPLSLDLNTAHDDWYGQGHPGKLSTASVTCGGKGPDGAACHSGNPVMLDNEVDLVKSSIMTTKAGELSAVRRMYGLDSTGVVPNLHLGEVAALYPNPLDGKFKQQQFVQSCLSQCHQSEGTLPVYALPGSTTSGPSMTPLETVTADGCESCHVLTNPNHTYTGNDVTIPRTETGFGIQHTLTTQIPYTQCNQCHNQGWHDPIKMTFTPRPDAQKVANDQARGNQFGSSRVKDYYLPGEVFATCEVRLDCIDCHTREDVMGDGHLYTSEYQAVHIQCQDCHGTLQSPPLSKTVTSSNDLAFEEQITNPLFPKLAVGDKIGLTHKGEEMPFVRKIGDKWVVYSRITGKQFIIPSVEGSACKQNPAEQGADACHSCHQ